MGDISQKLYWVPSPRRSQWLAEVHSGPHKEPRKQAGALCMWAESPCLQVPSERRVFWSKGTDLRYLRSQASWASSGLDISPHAFNSFFPLLFLKTEFPQKYVTLFSFPWKYQNKCQSCTFCSWLKCTVDLQRNFTHVQVFVLNGSASASQFNSSVLILTINNALNALNFLFLTHFLVWLMPWRSWERGQATVMPHV